MGIDNTDIDTKPQLISPPLFCPMRTVKPLALLVAEINFPHVLVVVRTVLSPLTLHCLLIKDTTFLSFQTVACSCFTCLLTQFAHILCLQTWGTNSSLMVSRKLWPNVLHTYSFCSQPTKVAACQQLKNEVLNCYKQNPTQALKCSQQVRDFLKCVELSQMVSLHSCCYKINSYFRF